VTVVAAFVVPRVPCSREERRPSEQAVHDATATLRDTGLAVTVTEVRAARSAALADGMPDDAGRIWGSRR